MFYFDTSEKQHYNSSLSSWYHICPSASSSFLQSNPAPMWLYHVTEVIGRPLGIDSSTFPIPRTLTRLWPRNCQHSLSVAKASAPANHCPRSSVALTPSPTAIFSPSKAQGHAGSPSPPQAGINNAAHLPSHLSKSTVELTPLCSNVSSHPTATCSTNATTAAHPAPAASKLPFAWDLLILPPPAPPTPRPHSALPHCLPRILHSSRVGFLSMSGAQGLPTCPSPPEAGSREPWPSAELSHPQCEPNAGSKPRLAFVAARLQPPGKASQPPQVCAGTRSH